MTRCLDAIERVIAAGVVFAFGLLDLLPWLLGAALVTGLYFWLRPDQWTHFLAWAQAR